MKVNRNKLWVKLLAIEPGVSASGGVTQSECVVLAGGRFYSMSQEVACSIPSGLDKDLTGAVPARKFIQILEKLPDEVVDVSIKDKVLCIKGGSQRIVKLAMEQEVLLPYDEVELPERYQDIPADFSEAADLASKCTREKGDFIQTCVHVHPKWLEATDLIRMLRYPVATGVETSVLVKGITLSRMTQMGMTRIAATDNWLHFRSPSNLRMSLRKFALESYPPLEEYLDKRGKVLNFPRSLIEVSKRAGIFADDRGNILVELSKDCATITGKCPQGEIQEVCEFPYKGEDCKFAINYKLIEDMLTRNMDCEITPESIRLCGGKYTFVSSLEVA